MKKEWSKKWVGSRKPSKQRKYRYNAPAHVRHKFLSAHLSPELRAQLGRRSLPVRKGDEVEVMKGEGRKTKGVVERVEAKNAKVYVAGIKEKKTDGSEVLRPIDPSNLKLVKANMDDKFRLKAVQRSARSAQKAGQPAARKQVSIETDKGGHSK